MVEVNTVSGSSKKNEAEIQFYVALQVELLC